MTGLKKMKKSVLTMLAVAAMSTTALAADVKPALVYGTGGKFDKSFNEAAYAGAEKFKAETGIDYRDFEPTGDTQGEQAIRNFASRGFNPVIAVSFAWTSAIEKVAGEFPDTKFVIVDSVVEKPNVRSVVYAEHEGSYLSSAFSQASLRRPARSASSAAWIFRSSASSNADTSRAHALPMPRLKSSRT